MSTLFQRTANPQIANREKHLCFQSTFFWKNAFKIPFLLNHNQIKTGKSHFTSKTIYRSILKIYNKALARNENNEYSTHNFVKYINRYPCSNVIKACFSVILVGIKETPFSGHFGTE